MRTKGAVLLEQWRKNRGLSQSKACAMLEIAQSPFSKFERGERKPGREVAVRIERGTGGFVPVASWSEQSVEVDATTTPTPV